MALAKEKGLQAQRSSLGIIGGNTPAQFTEAGIGALMPWANRLYFHNYTAESGQGDGMGLWSMGADGIPRLEVENNYCDTARFTYGDFALVGRYRISSAGIITKITGFQEADRVCSWAKIPPTGQIYALTMEGLIYVVNTVTWVASQVANADTGMGITSGGGDPHFKALWGMGSDATNARLIAVSNGTNNDGRLGRWNPTGGTWATHDPNGSYVETAGSYMGNKHAFATGHDQNSVVLKLYDGQTATSPRTFRLPFGSEQQINAYQQEWMRIRAVETERFLMDAHGMFYELSTYLGGSNAAATDFPRISPICRHGRTIPDFAVFNGALVLGGNNVSPQAGNIFPNAGQPQSGLLFTTLDDLWSWGKPQGHGWLCKAKSFTAAEVSDPMLMRGFDRKVLHLVNGTGSSATVDVLIYLGGTPYLMTTRTVAANAYDHFEFPAGFAADWVAVRPTGAITSLSARVDYT